MNFDQMMDSWRSQEEAPLYGVNRDLLQLVLQHEQAHIRRELRIEQWTAYAVGIGAALFGTFWIWQTIMRADPIVYTAAAGLGTAAFALWAGAFWLSRRRQALRERGFGNSLQEEIRGNLSLVDYQLSRAGRWSAALLWAAPVMVGSVLLYALLAAINDNTAFMFDVAMIALVVVSILWTTYATSCEIRQELEPRRQKLRELLAKLEGSE
jgi:hypothetical protein